MWSARIASVMALAACVLSAQIAPQKLEEAKRLSQVWKQWAGGRERAFAELTPKDQLAFLIGTARNNRYTPNRDAALALLSQWPYEQGLAKALENNPEGAQALAALGYSRPLASGAQGGPPRPWIRGVGLHLDPAGWRLQVIPAPEFMAGAPGDAGLPAPLLSAPIPSVLVRLDQLRPGLARLAQVAGGPQGQMLRTAAAGSRAGFLLSHVQAWLAKSDAALAPLADRPAWILHYGVQRPREYRQGQIPAPEGTLLFLPGRLPGRTNLALGLLRLNPFSAGARVRSGQLQDGKAIEVIHGAGGVLYLQETADGAWISDRISALEARERGYDTTLAQVEGWGRVAMSGVGRASASLWMIPRQGTLDGYSGFGSAVGPATAVSPGLLKASPRGGGAVLALGSGPTARALQAFFSVDMPFQVPVPEQPTLAGGAFQMNPNQQKSFEEAKAEAQHRASRMAGLRRTLDRLLRTLDGQGATLHWNGWTAAPPLNDAEKAALQAFRKQGYWTNARKERMNQAPGFGGFGEPGFTPSLAFALPLRAGAAAEAEAALKGVFAQAFKGALETRQVGPVALRRMRTAQAFAPSFAISGDILVLATDDAAAATVLAGLQGQAPTLADLPPAGWGELELDGPRIASDLEQLLLAYLGAQSGRPRRWWEPEAAAQSGDEVSEEVAATFGPFLNLVKQQGRLRMAIFPGGSGFELRPL